MGISKWNAGIIRPVPVAPTGPYQNSSAPGVWTVDQQAYWQKQGLWPTPGNIDPSSFIENLFSTYLYTGTSGSNTITNGINLSVNGGLVWVKSRSGASSGSNHILQDTVRGANKQLRSNTTGAEGSDAVNWSFNSSGFSMNTSISYLNDSGTNYASWTFREQAKFFDVVTYTGTGSNTTIAHSLGAVPGCIIVKRTDTTAAWAVYHRSLANTQYLVLNDTAAAATGATWWNSTTPTSAVFSVGTDASVNASGGTYIAYIYAHDAGGFGLTGTDNVISCGSFVTGATGVETITLGYEPQWVLFKRSDSTSDWIILDTMRGFPNGQVDAYLQANTSAAETTAGYGHPTATGFVINAGFGSGQTYIYIAIRRGPMAVPTLGTSVFSPNTQTGAGTTAGQTLTTSFPVDLEISEGRATNSGAYFIDRLRGGQNYMTSVSTAAEVNFTGYTPLISFANNTGILDANYGSTSNAYVAWNFRRAPGFFDEVCYTGTGSAQNVTHNLTVVPELMIIKLRSAAGGSWPVYHVFLGPSSGPSLTYTNAAYWGGSSNLNSTTPTNSVFTVGTDTETNDSSKTYVAYLFATCAGVSKVGNYTGTGALQTVACGFTSGARFVLIKRTDSTGDWYIWDSARGITVGDDPYLLLNSTAAEVTNTNYVDTDTTGFKVTAAAPAGINANGGTYIFLAIA